VVLLHRLDDDAHRVGKVCYNGDAWRAVTYEHIVSACAHYVSNTFFRFAGATLQLLLGIPQEGPPSVELCFLFCLYCEDLWCWRHSSTPASSLPVVLFDGKPSYLLPLLRWKR
jgi:hypothetical protein